MTRNPSRREVVQITSTALGASIIPASASANQGDSSGDHQRGKDIRIYNNSDKKSTVSVSIYRDSRSQTSFSESYSLQGLNNPRRTDGATHFRGRIHTTGSGVYTIRAEADGNVAEEQVRVTKDGIPDGQFVTVYIQPEGDVVARRIFA